MLPGEEKITRRRKWNDEEDELLLSYVNTYGFDNWRTISSLMSGRDSKQCRERYINHLDPNVRKGKLSIEEWATLHKAHEDLGNKWTEIAKRLPGRTANALKNCWHSKLREGGNQEGGASQFPTENQSHSGDDVSGFQDDMAIEQDSIGVSPRASDFLETSSLPPPFPSSPAPVEPAVTYNETLLEEQNDLGMDEMPVTITKSRSMESEEKEAPTKKRKPRGSGKRGRPKKIREGDIDGAAISSPRFVAALNELTTNNHMESTNSADTYPGAFYFHSPAQSTMVTPHYFTPPVSPWTIASSISSTAQESDSEDGLQEATTFLANYSEVPFVSHNFLPNLYNYAPPQLANWSYSISGSTSQAHSRNASFDAGFKGHESVYQNMEDVGEDYDSMSS